ncbi:squalene--hopene cyclase [Actinopolymorpha rutila]|uniref:Squalene-hopene/tetraprenyl-beta-curcumene cyclase n=1 Tax=Actinopolymorpha rutila TaxID=446787 RepID=A0A852ZUU6_9ACTN|nr:squalene--hopene cyclase [Actinopolymorpha rutila]NYH93099.1 squalene-hopene/tetraprenyl-beta-curcumene cyclase [Actinopolymorpha rutila]
MAGLSPYPEYHKAPEPQKHPDDDAQAHAALERAVEHLLDLQDPAGWWKGELETNVTMDAEDLLMRQFLGVRTDEQTTQSAAWIRSQQRDDGSWANFRFGPGDVSTSVEAYVALRLAGDDPDDQHLKQARQFILDNGGVEAARVFTKIWLSLFGEWSWDDVPALPPEIVLAPHWVPFNVYDWGCWARQTLVPLTILGALRPNRPLGVSIDELRTGTPEPPPDRATTWRGAFARLDRALHRYERHPVRSVRRLALRRAAEWVVARQEKDGCWGGIQPPWVYSLMALHALGYPLDHPVLTAGLAGWERFTIREDTPHGTVRRIEACQSPVWDTALALVALGDAGVDPEAGPMVRARDWLLAEEITVRGDWSVRRPRTPAGGWAFEFDNDGYPDTDDTAEVVLGLRRTAETPRLEEAVRRARVWLRGMQCRDGGWGAFDADNTRELAYQLPFCDFGAVIDPPSADVTAHVVEMFAHEGHADDPEVQRAVRWLLDAQEADGSWYGRWGANHVYGTGAVLPALVAAGLSRHDRAVVRGANWLTAHQNADGGWGEDLRSYSDPSWVGRGTSTASQTAWALLALEAAGLRDSPAVRAGIAWLVATQRPDGGWDEPQFTGTGFPGDFYINYHLYRLVFPVTALGRLLAPAGDPQDRA